MSAYHWKNFITKLKLRFSHQSVNDVKLNELMSKVTEKNKHGLVFCEKPSSFKPSKPIDENASFTIQIHVEPYEETQKRWRRQTQAIREGNIPEVTRHLSFELWDDFLNILTDEGKAMIEDMRGD